MEQTQTSALVSKYRLMGRTITVNTIDGKVITGNLIEEESNWLTIIDIGKSVFFVTQSSIASMSVELDSSMIKYLPQTPLRK